MCLHLILRNVSSSVTCILNHWPAVPALRQRIPLITPSSSCFSSSLTASPRSHSHATFSFFSQSLHEPFCHSAPRFCEPNCPPLPAFSLDLDSNLFSSLLVMTAPPVFCVVLSSDHSNDDSTQITRVTTKLASLRLQREVPFAKEEGRDMLEPRSSKPADAPQRKKKLERDTLLVFLGPFGNLWHGRPQDQHTRRLRNRSKDIF